MENKDVIIKKTIAFVQEQLKDAEGGHDWFHIERVWNLAKRMAVTEPCNILIVELGALLHDIGDSKFHNGDETVGPRLAKNFLTALALDPLIIKQVENIIIHISFKNSLTGQLYKTIELDIVQDADRLDAMGAIGIARAFNYGGFKNRKLFDPTIPPVLKMTKEAYKNSNAPTLNHFHEKLFLLKDRMNTPTGKKMAEGRHLYMEEFVNQFHKEWNGEL